MVRLADSRITELRTGLSDWRHLEPWECSSDIDGRSTRRSPDSRRSKPLSLCAAATTIYIISRARIGRSGCGLLGGKTCGSMETCFGSATTGFGALVGANLSHGESRRLVGCMRRHLGPRHPWSQAGSRTAMRKPATSVSRVTGHDARSGVMSTRHWDSGESYTRPCPSIPGEGITRNAHRIVIAHLKEGSMTRHHATLSGITCTTLDFRTC